MNPWQILRISLGIGFSLDELCRIINDANLSDLSIKKNTVNPQQKNIPWTNNIPQQQQQPQPQPTTQTRDVPDRNVTSRRTQTRIDNFFTERRERRQQEENVTFGDCIPPDKHGHHRLLTCNVNGISPQHQMAKLQTICSAADAFQVDYLGLSETNLDYNHYNIGDRCNNIIRKHFMKPKSVFASSSISFNKPYQPGGVMSILSHPLSSHSTISKDESSMGRWTETTIMGRKNRKVTIITAYVVCPQSQSEIANKKYTAFTQQWHILKRENPGKPNIDPRSHMWTDLGKRVKQLRDCGNELVIMMDANDSLQKLNSSITTFAKDNELLDLIVERHGTNDEPATHSRGSQRIDYILTTEKISEYVSACGILPFHELCFSDHRALYADIDIKGFLQCFPPDNLNRITRGIQSHDPRAVKAYQLSISSALDENNLEELIEIAQSQIEDPNSEPEAIATLLEEIDTTFTKMKLDCEQASSNNHKLPWSPTLKRAYNNKIFWSLWLSQSRSETGRSKKKLNLHEARLKFVTEDTVHFSLAKTMERKHIYFQLKRADKYLKEVQERAAELRDEFLTEQAKMAADSQQKDLEHIILAIRNAERRKRMFAKLKSFKHDNISHGIGHIIIQDENGEKVSVTDPDEMVQRLIEQNTKHFSQADGSPFTIEPLKSLLGETGTSTFASDVLSGKIDINTLGLEEAVDAILKRLQIQMTEETIPEEITNEEVIQGYKRWSEFTSTSPSGTHLSHEKVILRLQKTQEKEAMENGTSPLYERYFRIKTFLINSALKTGHVYQRWKKVVNALIEKIPGTPLINKLRVIHLIESDFNLMIGILWGRKLIWAGEDNSAFNEGQGGSRPGRRTQELLMIKHLQYSILRLNKMNGASFDNDAKSCFDRIVMPLASISAQQLGMPPKACEIFLNTLQQIKYHVKTNYGISEESYSTTDEHTIHGPGQGGRGSPAVWVVISSLIMHCLEQKSKGFTIQNPYDKNDTFTHWMTGFVDDVTQWCSSNDTQSEQQAVAELQMTAQWWEQLLHATGGKLELSKCFFYIVQWDFDAEGVAQLRPPEQFIESISITSSETGIPVTIPHRPCTQAHKTLGVMECPDGSNYSEYDRLLTKSRALVQRISSRKIPPMMASLYYFTTYLPSISYGQTIGTLTKEQCAKVESPAIQQITAAMGFTRSIPNAIKYGHRDLGGIGLRHLFAEQGTEKCTTIIRYLRCNRPVSNILRTQLRTAQVFAGTSTPILEDDSKLPHLSQELWIQTLREFLIESDIQLKIYDLMPSKLQCAHDEYIMDTALNMSISAKNMEQINRCRIYLRCTTISDIATACGYYITEEAWKCQEEGMIIDNDAWPNQPRPGPAHQATWRSFLRQLCKDDGKSKGINKTLLLENPLGQWLTHTKIRKRGHDNLFIQEDDTTAVRKVNTTWEQGQVQSKWKHGQLSNTTTTDTVPETTTSIPAMYIHGDEHKIKWRKRIKAKVRIIDTQINSWHDYSDSVQEWESQLLQNIELVQDMESIKSILTNENQLITCVSDGGVDESTGYYGWVIAHNDDILVQGKGHVPGTPMSSQRAECCGKLSWLTWLIHSSIFHQLEIKCSIESYCDNKSVVDKTKRANDYANPSYTITPNYDMFKSIYDQQLRIPAQSLFDTKWVKGHQDTNPNEQLSLEARLNIKADKLATQARSDISSGQIDPSEYAFPAGKVALVRDNMIISSQEAHIIRWRYSEFQLHEYYARFFKVPHLRLHDINWAGLRLARNRLSLSEQTFSIKQTIDWLPTGFKLKQYGKEITNCPLCDLPCEDGNHLWTCTTRLARNREIITEFKLFLTKIDTDPVIAQILLHKISKWLAGSNTSPSEALPDSMTIPYHKAIALQESYGWHLLVRGLLTNEWASIQEQLYWKPKGVVKLGDSWSASISEWWIRKSRHEWLARNERTHSTLLNSESRLEQETYAQVRKLYESQERLSANDRELFSRSIEDLLADPWQSLQTWVEQATRTVAICLQAQMERIVNFQPHIDQVFTAQTPTITNNLDHYPTRTTDATPNQESIPTTEDRTEHCAINEEIT